MNRSALAFSGNTLLAVLLRRQGPCSICDKSDCLECWHYGRYAWDKNRETFRRVSVFLRSDFEADPNTCAFCREYVVDPKKQRIHSCAPMHPALVLPMTNMKPSTRKPQIFSELGFLDALVKHVPVHIPTSVEDQKSNLAEATPGKQADVNPVKWNVTKYLPTTFGASALTRGKRAPYCLTHSIVYHDPVPDDKKPKLNEDDGRMII